MYFVNPIASRELMINKKHQRKKTLAMDFRYVMLYIILYLQWFV